MDYYQLSAAAFADTIHVGRSSISHILSGRNKPSLEFVMKIIDAFPEVELYWLLSGQGHFPKSTIALQTKKEDLPPTPKNVASIPEEKKTDLFTTTPTQLPKNNILEEKKINTENNRTIDRIVVFYEDGSFESYTQR